MTVTGGFFTKIRALPGSLTVISVVADSTCAREASRPSKTEGRRERALISTRPPPELVPVFVIFVPAALLETCAT